MAILIPTDLSLDGLEKNERKFVKKILNQLTDSWLVIPRFDIRGARRTYELDVLLINESYGLIGVEVKGGKIEVKSGEWYQNKEAMPVSPPRQAQNAAYELRDILKLRARPLFDHFYIDYAVALPGVNDLDDVLPADIERERLILDGDMENLDDAIYRLMTLTPKNRPLSSEQVREILFFLRPDSNFRWNKARKLSLNKERLRKITLDEVSPLLSLDQNRNIFVTGGAGTGKSLLATLWQKEHLYAVNVHF